MGAARKAASGAAAKSRNMNYIQELFARAKQLHASGNLADAMAEYNRILEKSKNHFGCWHMLGLCYYQQGHYDMAVHHLKRAVLLDTQSALAQSDLGIALKALRRGDEALACFDRAIALKPDYADAHYNRANLLCDRGKYAEAVEGFDRTIAIKPGHMSAWKNRGNALRVLHNWSDALTSYDKAIAIDPSDAGSWSNRAEALRGLRRFDDSIESCERAFSIDPNLAAAWIVRSSIMTDIGREAEAMAACQRAIEINPRSLTALFKLSECLAQRGDVEAAVACLDKCLAFEPDDEATLSKRVFLLDFLPDADFAAHQEARSLWWSRIGAKIAVDHPPRYGNNFDPNKRIVLGYVSADFKHHSAALTYRQVLQHCDRSQFEVICYSCSAVEDGMTASFRQLSDRWRDAQLWSDDQLAQSIQNDRVDILIDLSGHSAGNRLSVFARKPAPIQVTAWGHATGTGLRTMDYLFSDPIMIPQEVRHLYAEQIYDLPCAIIIETPRAARESEPPVNSNGHVTYGVFNRVSKISGAAVALWARILQSDRNARLMIKDVGIDDVSVADVLRHKFAGHGIELDRLNLVGTTTRAQHLAAYGAIDICLDPFPHGGGVSSWEALHMGVPIVTKIGNALSKRIAGGIMSAIGLVDWVASNDDQYVDIALRASPDRLRALRRELPDLIAARCGPVAYSNAVDQAYRTMWKKRCAHQH